MLMIAFSILSSNPFGRGGESKSTPSCNSISLVDVFDPINRQNNETVMTTPTINAVFPLLLSVGENMTD